MDNLIFTKGKLAKLRNILISRFSSIFFILRPCYCSEEQRMQKKRFKKACLTSYRYEIHLSQDSNWQNREHFYLAILKHFHYSVRLALSRNGISAWALKTFLTQSSHINRRLG